MKLFYTALVITGSVSIICAISVPASINYLNSILYDVISKNESFIFSPFGAHSALSLAYQGADGQTKRTLRTVLFLLDEMSTAAEYRKMIRTLTSAKHVQLNIANKIYLQTGYQFKPHFRFIAEDFFYGEADTIDFRRSSAAAEEINNWVKEKTHKRNIKLFSFADFGLDTQAVLVNAMYFSSAWSSPFNKKNTRWDKFYVSDKETLTLPMMLQAGYFEYDELVQLDAKILSMRYKNRSFAMTIILPNSRTGINELEKKLPKYNLNMLQPKGMKKTVLLTLPKFRIETTLHLQDPLKKIGLRNMFSISANFSDMIENQSKLRIDKVVQKTFIYVNETGAEGDTGSGDKIPPRSVERNFTVDHPFMFYISETRGPGTILFVGKVLAPIYQKDVGV